MKALELKVPPLIVMLIVGGLCTIIYKCYRLHTINSLFIDILAIILFTLATLSVFSAVFNFRNKETTVDPLYPDKSKYLIVSGVYRFSRNPMYLGFYLWLLSYTLYLGDVLMVLLTPLFIVYINRFQIVPEEKILFDKFGADYLSYKNSVRR